jgi:hypothetical protein
MMQRSRKEEGGVQEEGELVDDAGGGQSWEKLLADLCLQKEVTNFEASLLDAVMKERRPLLRAAIVTKADSSEWIGTEPSIQPLLVSSTDFTLQFNSGWALL